MSVALTINVGSSITVQARDPRIVAVGTSGPAGPPNSLSVSGTTTAAYGTPAAVVISGSAPTQSLAFTIPTGPQGNKGDTGDTGVVVGTTAPADTSKLWADTGDAGSQVIPAGGTTGQALVKSSSTDYATTWATPSVATHASTHAAAGSDPVALSASQVTGAFPASQITGTALVASTVTAKGDLLAATGSGAMSRLGVGTDGQMLVADSAQTTGVGWVDRVKPADLLAMFGMSTTVVDSVSRLAIAGVATAVTGTEYVATFTPLVTLTVTGLSVSVGATGFSGNTLIRMGIFAMSGNQGTLLARTAALTSLTAATVTRTALDTGSSFPGSVTLQAGTRYGLTFLAVGGTMGVLHGTASVASSGGLFNGASVAPQLYMAATGRTDLPTTVGGTSSHSAASQGIWMRAD